MSKKKQPTEATVLTVNTSDGVEFCMDDNCRRQKDGEHANHPPLEEFIQPTIDVQLRKNYRHFSLREERSPFEWRKKWGAWLVKDILEDDSLSYMDEAILYELPENYKVISQIKYDSDEKLRNDYYIYGHPNGCSAVFRSAADFYPHLKWLVLGQDGKCECKQCKKGVTG
ncbi:hypothetical protein K470DRAFT_270748 [Piedraia hortae CBS 480.64]|uniref:Cryptic loci regulator 2 N-terminal domain-containing protein n=1 Tax=Piedraia hortae CBS 480.64 TaxID=1314780 RepID=A0A6A7BZ89_9PEZI|nr:hypothetical protein K470DRAFT_270748 [Piedraia hortae CBS 480.64]